MQKKISLVSSGKLFFAFCVLGIHSGAFENSALRSYVFSLAVPFFFICSGYFLGVKINHINNLKEYQSVLNQYFKRLVVPYFIWGGGYTSWWSLWQMWLQKDIQFGMPCCFDSIIGWYQVRVEGFGMSKQY